MRRCEITISLEVMEKMRNAIARAGGAPRDERALVAIAHEEGADPMTVFAVAIRAKTDERHKQQAKETDNAVG